MEGVLDENGGTFVVTGHRKIVSKFIWVKMTNLEKNKRDSYATHWPIQIKNFVRVYYETHELNEYKKILSLAKSNEEYGQKIDGNLTKTMERLKKRQNERENRTKAKNDNPSVPLVLADDFVLFFEERQIELYFQIMKTIENCKNNLFGEILRDLMKERTKEALEELTSHSSAFKGLTQGGQQTLLEEIFSNQAKESDVPKILLKQEPSNKYLQTLDELLLDHQNKKLENALEEQIKKLEIDALNNGVVRARLLPPPIYKIRKRLSA